MVLSKEELLQMREMMEDFFLIGKDIAKDDVADRAHFTNDEDNVKLMKHPRGSYLLDPADDVQSPAQIYSGSGTAKSINTGRRDGDSVGLSTTAVPAVIGLTQHREIIAILAELKCDVNVADRDLQVLIAPPFRVITGLASAFATGLVRLTASEEGSIFMATGHETFLNDNGAQTQETTNPLPFEYPPTTSITATSPNLQAGDLVGLTIVTRQVA